MKNIHLPVRVSSSELNEIEAFQKKHKIASRAEAVRQLVYLGLEKPYVAPIREKKRYVSFEDLHAIISKSVEAMADSYVDTTLSKEFLQQLEQRLK